MTGYTQELVDRDLNLKDFALVCTRAFGFCITMRDERLDAPIPEEFKLDEHHKNALDAAQKSLEELKSLAQKGVVSWARKEIKNRIKDFEGYIEADKKKGEKEKCEKMLKKVKKWKPPTEEHIGLKNFMIEQLSGSIKFANTTKYYKEEITKLKKLTPKEYYELKIKEATWNVNYHIERWQKEQENHKTKNQWFKELRASLESK